MKNLLLSPFKQGLFPLTVLIISLIIGCSAGKSKILISCRESNDLYRVLKQNNIPLRRFDTPQEAVRKSGKGAGILILADDYPAGTTSLDSLILEEAGRKKL